MFQQPWNLSSHLVLTQTSEWSLGVLCFFPVLLLILAKVGESSYYYEHFPGSPFVLIVRGLHFSTDYDFSIECQRRLAVSGSMKAILNSFNDILYSNEELLKVTTLENAVFVLEKVNSFFYVYNRNFNHHWSLPLRSPFSIYIWELVELKLMEFIFACIIDSFSICEVYQNNAFEFAKRVGNVLWL